MGSTSVAFGCNVTTVDSDLKVVSSVQLADESTNAAQ
jgi:hypothetical protein